MHLEDSILEDWYVVEGPEPDSPPCWTLFLPSTSISALAPSCHPTFAAGIPLVRDAGLTAQLQDAIDTTSVIESHRSYGTFTPLIPPLDEEGNSSSNEEDVVIECRLQNSRQKASAYGLNLTYSREFHKFTHSIVDAVDLTASIKIKKQVVGSGGYSSVYLAIWKSEKVALKALRITVGKPHTFQRRLSREILVLSSLDHPNVTPLYGFAATTLSELPGIVTPWYANSSADKYLPRYKPSIAKRLKLCMDTTNGLLYLHSLKPTVVHGDLKPSNVLIDDLGNARLCDFGLASLLCEEAGSGFTTTTEYLGTPRYAAPEIFNRPIDAVEYKPTPASDIFSLGSVIYEFITGNVPYPHLRSSPYLGMQILSQMLQRRPPARPSHEPEKLDLRCRGSELWSLLDRCWDFDPRLRPSALHVEEELTVIQSKVAKYLLPILTDSASQ